METQTIDTTPRFDILNNKTLAEYSLIFHINDIYSTNDLSKFTSKHQLLFQKLEDKNQQLNLAFVDSAFVNILADLTLEVLIKKISTFREYILSKEKIRLVEPSAEETFLAFKFSDFLYLNLFGDISNKNTFNQKLFSDRVYCFKNNFGELEYYSMLEKQDLQHKLLDEVRIEIVYEKSAISKQEAKICLRFIL